MSWWEFRGFWGILQRSQVEIDAGDEAVFEFVIGEAVPLSEQDGTLKVKTILGGKKQVS